MLKCLPGFELGYSRDQILKTNLFQIQVKHNCILCVSLWRQNTAQVVATIETYIDGGVYISDKFRTKYLSREFFKFVKKFTGLELNWFLQYTWSNRLKNCRWTFSCLFFVKKKSYINSYFYFKSISVGPIVPP